MRSDFVSNCAIFPQLNALLNRQFVQIGAMHPDELVSAIAQPALRVGLRIDPDLIAQIINDMQGEPGVLPLMQFALKDLFDSQQAKGAMIALTLNNYLQRGGIHKALERHADKTFAMFSTDEKELARSIFTGLIEIGRGTQDTRRTVLSNELIPTGTQGEVVKTVVQKLASARLITTEETTVTISHEKLIEAWPWLRKLVNENRDIIALRNEIFDDTKDWEEHQRDPSYLYRGARLATAQEKFKKLALSGRARIFLNASIKTDNLTRQHGQRLQRRLITDLMIFLGVITILLIFSSTQIKIFHAQLLGSQARVSLLNQEYDHAMLLAYQSKVIHENDDADSVLSELVYTNFTLRGLKIEEPARILLGLSANITNVSWSPNGQQLASVSSENNLIIWDFTLEKTTQILQDNTDHISSVTWSPSGQLLAGVSGSTNTIVILDLKTGQSLKPLKEPSGSMTITAVAWSPDGQQLASGSSAGTITLWDVKTGQPTDILDARGLPGYEESNQGDQSVLCLAWSPDGQLAAGSANYGIIVWNLKTGAPPQTLWGHTNPVHSVAWSRGGQLASSSSVVIIWDLDRGRPAITLQTPTDITSLAWSPDEQLASSSSDGSIVLWNLEARKPAQIIRAHTGSINSISWSSLGQLASGSVDQSIKITRGDLSGVNPCENLTTQEWLEYVSNLFTHRPACSNLYDPTFSQGRSRQYLVFFIL